MMYFLTNVIITISYLQVEFCLPWHVDYDTVIAHSSLHQAWPEANSFVPFGELHRSCCPFLAGLTHFSRSGWGCSCHFRDHHTGVTQQLLCSFFILPTLLQLHYDICKCCRMVEYGCNSYLLQPWLYISHSKHPQSYTKKEKRYGIF